MRNLFIPSTLFLAATEPAGRLDPNVDDCQDEISEVVNPPAYVVFVGRQGKTGLYTNQGLASKAVVRVSGGYFKKYDSYALAAGAWNEWKIADAEAATAAETPMNHRPVSSVPSVVSVSDESSLENDDMANGSDGLAP
ncbi:hypothetical protein OF83DRAFT_1085050 [Amylostereum chailletii]|nr:hypothetical protein OF83DRAFT_1085050 [Amylostereum chailletii]